MKILKLQLFLTILILAAGVLKYARAEEQTNYKFIVDSLEKIGELEGAIEMHLTFDEYEQGVKVSGEVKQFVDLDNEWKVNIEIFKTDNAEDEEKKLIALPAMGVCDFMNSIYKKYLYETLKNFSNAPDPDKCAVTKETYIVKDYPFDVNKFKNFLKPGYYTIKITLLHEEVEVAKYMMKGHAEEV